MKKDVVTRLLMVAVVFTLVNFSVIQQRRINDLANQVAIADQRSDVNTEFTNELVWMRINDVHGLNKDQLIAQGRIEGVVSYLSGDNTQDMDNLWHEGYTRGLSQTDYQYDVIADSSYEKGYHAAMQDAFPNHPNNPKNFVNEAPRKVEDSVIKTPEFDENSQDLESTEELVDKLNTELNNKIKRPDDQ